MSMYFCHYVFAASVHPKFLNEAIRLLTGAENKVFIDSGDVEILAFKVEDALVKARPRSSTACITKHVPDTGNILIDIYANNRTDTSIARAQFAPVRAFTTWDLDEGRFIEVKLKMEENQS